MVNTIKGQAIGRNVLTNVVGGSWSIILYLLVIPVQIRILGVDAFGLLSFINSLQVIFQVFDLGLTPTITREVVIDDSPGLRHSRELLQTLSVMYAVIGLLLGGMVFLGADLLVQRWLELGALPADSARSALQLGALAVTLRWPVSFYGGVIAGRGRFGILNALRAASSTFRLLGGALVLLAFPDLVAFAAWLALSALVEVLLYLVGCFRSVPGLSLRPRLSRPVLARVWHYALSVNLNTIISTAVAQSDRLLLSALVSIETFGYYSLAQSVLRGLSDVQVLVTSALFPSFAASHAEGANAKLASDYTRSAQVLVYVYALPASAIIFFGNDILRLWTSAEIAATASPILIVLAPGFLLNAAVAVASTLATATGNMVLVIRANLVGLLVYLPILYLAIVQWGVVGAAVGWLLLNLLLFLTIPLSAQRRILGQGTMGSVVKDVLAFVALGTISFGSLRFISIISGWTGSGAVAAACLAGTMAYSLIGLRLLDSSIRRALWTMFRSLVASPREEA